MTLRDHADSDRVRFTSSAARPLACIAGSSLSLGQFRADVERLMAQLQPEGDTLISCPGRYAFSVDLLTDKAREYPYNCFYFYEFWNLPDDARS